MRKVVITGLGTINPAGLNIEQFNENLKKGKTFISSADNTETPDFPIKVWGKVNSYVPEEYFKKTELNRMDKFIQFAVISAQEAMKDCGTDFSDLNPYKCGVITGVGFGGLLHTEREHEKFLTKGKKGVSATYIPSMISNMASGYISIKTGLKGSDFTVCSACASSTHAIGEAFRKVKDGYLDMCLCGGSESCLTKFSMSGFGNMKALTECSDPERASIPFDKERSGFVLGEGAAMLVLETEEHAKARGAKIYAEICGYGSTGDAFHVTRPEPEAEAVCAAIEMAIEESGMSADDIDYINAHGTSTHFNDATESTAINKVFGSRAKDIYVNSTKSIIGHLLGGAGAAEACASVLEISGGYVHPVAGYTTPDPECDLNIVHGKTVETEIKGALSMSLGFGGHNGVLCFRKYSE